MTSSRSRLTDITNLLRADGRWGSWPMPSITDVTGTTMADVAAAAAAGAPEGTVVVAEEQTEGRGRRGRTWESARHAGLWQSILLRPVGATAEDVGWIPLVVGVGVAEGIEAVGGMPVGLKWPNDVIVERDGPHKVAGLLAERLADGAVVVGIGINVDHASHELPDGGGSLRSLGQPREREDVLVAVLAAVADRYREWRRDPRAAQEDYRRRCVTVGQRVTVTVGERASVGTALRIDPSGRLVVADDEGVERAVSAGDVTHVRSAS